MSRKNKSSETPSFFKVLSNVDYSELLRLPPTFLRRYELNLPEYVKLRVEDSRRRWNVRVERMDNGLFCFTNGWRKFAEEAALQLGEFLVFSLTAKFEFEVIIYETSCCKREIPLLEEDVEEREIKRGAGRPPKRKIGGIRSNRFRVEVKAHGSYMRKWAKVRDEAAVSNTNRYSKESSNPLYFEKCIKTHYRSRINLPQEFSKAANLKVKRRVRMEYVGDDGHGISVALDPRPEGHRTDLAEGWSEFRETNRLVFDEKIYSFEFNPDDQVIYLKEVAPRNRRISQ